ncbi:MAG TPA: hypothetical protein P5230_03045 [Candidatus Magasanikbacteria bacterium]|nr:hypothetical protein [Candidatus Magasanikbacteria bacterium]
MKQSLTPEENKKEFIKALEKGWFEDVPFWLLSGEVDPNCIFGVKKGFLVRIFSRRQAVFLLKIFKENGLQLNGTDVEGISLLEIAICQRDSSLFRELLELGVEVNIQTSEKKSALLLSVEYAAVTKKFYGIEFVEDLLRRGAKPGKDFPSLKGEDFLKSPSVLAKELCQLIADNK